MTFKEAMMEMIDGKECVKAGLMRYRFNKNQIQYYSSLDKGWVLSLDDPNFEGLSWESTEFDIVIDGKTIKLSEESYNELKRSLT